MDNSEKWRESLLRSNATIQQAIRNLNESGVQIVLVVSNEGNLLGTITDGDIRRGLLQGLGLNSGIDLILNTKPLVVPPGLDRSIVLHVMEANRIHQLPIVNRQHQVVGLHLWDKLNSMEARQNRMIIMAGGLGTRLRPYTDKCPKPLLPISGKPILEHIIHRAKADGFRHIIIATGYLGQMIEDYFGHGERWQVHIEYLREKKPLGTAGALTLLEPLNLPIIVTNGDVLSDVRYGDLIDFHVSHNATATMAIRTHEWQNPFGVVHLEGSNIIGFEEKPICRTNVNAGIYAFDPIALRALPREEHCDMPAFFKRLIHAKKRVIVYPMHESWLDVGCPNDYVQANEVISGEDRLGVI